eukprot:gene5960-biopygen11808
MSLTYRGGGQWSPRVAPPGGRSQGPLPPPNKFQKVKDSLIYLTPGGARSPIPVCPIPHDCVQRVCVRVCSTLPWKSLCVKHLGKSGRGIHGRGHGRAVSSVRKSSGERPGWSTRDGGVHGYVPTQDRVGGWVHGPPADSSSLRNAPGLWGGGAGTRSCRSSPEFPGVTGAPWSTTEHHGALRSTTEHYGAPRSTTEHHGATRSTTEHHGAQRSSTAAQSQQLAAFPCAFLEVGGTRRPRASRCGAPAASSASPGGEAREAGCYALCRRRGKG